ncbi:SufD family Fe-S cluster assembly protein [Escherichia coli]|nr:SufD family Fe-S cluster assembly protein [Escherichia coli]
MFIVTHNLYQAQKVTDDLASVMPDRSVLLYPVNELIASEIAVASPELRAQRLDVLNRLANGENPIVVTPAAAVRRMLPPVELWKESQIHLKVGEEIDLEAFSKQLVQIGYDRTSMVAAPGDFSVRGGIIDIYALTEDHPIRIELFDTEVDSIRSFHSDTQRSLETLQEIKIGPAKGAPFGSLEELPEEVKSLIDLEDTDKTVYIQRDQTPAYLSLSNEAKDKGVIFTDIHTAIREHGDLVKKYFMTDAVKVDEHKLTALHAALVNGGAFLYVPKNVELDAPIQAVYLHENDETTLFNHVIVVADDHSAVTYVENYISTATPEEAIFNIVSEVFTGANARVTYGAVDNLAEGVTVYVNRRGMANGRDSKIEWALGLMNDGDVVSENITKLMGIPFSLLIFAACS